MSEAIRFVRSKPYTIAEASDMLDAHETRIKAMEPTFRTIEKVYSYLKYATPALIFAMLGNINPASWLGKFLSAVIASVHG